MMASKLTGIVNPILSDETTLSLDFGNTYSDGSLHKGIDVYSSLKRECAVIAPCAGTVTALCNNVKGTNKSSGTLGMGNYVYLQTDNGLRLRFQHMKYGSVVVKKGQVVKKGAKLGIIGNTGYSSGRHLHFDVSCAGKNSGGRYVSSQNRTYFDPKPFIRGAKSLTKSTQKASESGSEVKLYTVTASALRVRSGAGLTYSAVDTIKQGTKVKVYEAKNGFGKISENSSKWVSMDYLKEV
jgi:murein DD-endopeptidase MepM/ murein hydrolase activator NlpD